MSTRYALLVGVDHYFNDRSRDFESHRISLPNLHGCVNDVELFRDFLQRTYNFDKFSVLLSPLQVNHSQTHAVSDNTLPSFANIKREFFSIESQIKPGDLFFFHFSGHGALLNRTSRSPLDRDKDPSLMTADYCCGKPALRGWQLNSWLKRLDRKGVQVIVSLDSCHSGGAWRGSGQHIVGFRTPDEWPSSIPNSEIDNEAVKDEESDEVAESATRDAVLEISWSINPQTFTLMTACETDQKAAELTRPDGKVGGAFTYGLIEYLEETKFQVSYRMARDHLQEKLDPQRPTCFGRDRFHFFGKSEPLNASPILFRLQDDRLQINAGRAHGICKGSEFTPFPISTTTTRTITINEVEEFKSSAAMSKEIGEALKQHGSKMIIPSRWCLGNAMTFDVVVEPGLGQEFRSSLREMLESRIVNVVNISGAARGDDTAFKIRRDRTGTNIVGPERVIGYSGPVRALKLRHLAADAKPEVIAAEAAAPLVHLARFKHILDLTPEDASDPQPFAVSVAPLGTTSAEGPYPTGQRFAYTFQNTSNEDLYLAVLNITPEFRIRQLIPPNDFPDRVIPGQSIKRKFAIDLPDPLPTSFEHEIYRSNRRDIIRTLVSTDRVSTWKTLELPAIWDADKVDSVASRPPLRDATVESETEWWVCDTHVFTKDINYTISATIPDPIPKGNLATSTSAERRDTKTYPISGIPKDPSAGIPIRQDVDDWYREQTGSQGNRIQLTLFTEALTAIQQRPVTDERSYFRLAGIHGAPWTDWDGSAAPKDKDNKATNFCVHNDYTFPTWHRVYIALFEQVVYEAMIDFIDKASDVADETNVRWKTEAKRWRLPYWDFARFASHDGTQGDELRLPILATLPMVKVLVLGPVSETVNKPNPLYKFQMQTPMGDLERPYNITSQRIMDNGREIFLPFDKCLSTTKYGLSNGYSPDVWADAGQNWLRANLALNEHPWYQNMDKRDLNRNLQDMTYRLFKTRLDNWGSFSTTRYCEGRDEPRNWMNLEAIHNNVHNWAGGFMFSHPGRDNLKLWGAGHMAHVPVAAFDPIFWLHHCNIDRLTAIWQCLNPDKWFDDAKSKESRGNVLRPFHRNTEGLVFRSDDVRDWTVFNYEYAITMDRRHSTKIEEGVKALYGQRTMDLYKKHDATDYILSVKYDRYALGGNPFQINIFFGSVDHESFYDSRSKNFVGSVFNFSGNLKDSHCSNCIEQEAQGAKAVSQLPATLAFHYYWSEYRRCPTPSYVVVDSQGKSVDITVEIGLHKAEARFFDPPYRGGGDYSRVSIGVPADVRY